MSLHLRTDVHPPRDQATRAKRVATEETRTRAGTWVASRRLAGQYGNISAFVVGHPGEPHLLFSTRSAEVADRVAP